MLTVMYAGKHLMADGILLSKHKKNICVIPQAGKFEKS